MAHTFLNTHMTLNLVLFRYTPPVLLKCGVIAAILLPWLWGTWMFGHVIEIDSLEQVVWADALEWGYYKHPPLTTWLAAAYIALLGSSAGSMYALGLLCVGLALWFVWAFAADILPANQALLAVLLITPLTYLTSRGLMYNHNTAQLVTVAGAIWAFWRATHRTGVHYWLLLGGFCGLGFITKYSMVVFFAAFAVYLLSSQKLFLKHTLIGVALAAAVMLVIVAPHLHWLNTHPVNPLKYASAYIVESTFASRLAASVGFIGVQIARLAPVALGVLLAAWWMRPSEKNSPQQGLKKEFYNPNTINQDAYLFVSIISAVPLLGVLCAQIFLNVQVMSHWAATFFILLGILLLRFVPSVNTAAKRNKIIIGFVAYHCVMALIYGVGRGPVAEMAGRPSRSVFPSQQLSDAVNTLWQSKQNTPLTLIASDLWTAGNITLAHQRKPAILLDGELDYSPWIDASTYQKCNYLVLVSSQEAVKPQLLTMLNSSSEKGRLTLTWDRLTPKHETVYQWGIMPGTHPQDIICKS
jgi:4-amino-4-deoxy-L-arabinose transferase-like glycosyltransferase